ncbi:MAG: UDP-GlcNAc3NAcA epimerase [Planctomycetota bacterium]|jgi:UDP-GlcNAc3NAcA epimerase
MKILTILGARPQFIKAGTLSRYISQVSNVEEVIVHTGQHYDVNMSEVFFEELKIPKPDHNLSLGALSHGAMTGRMIEEIEKVALKELPDWIVVYGDTNSTLAGAIVASKLHIRLAHIEAGLRSYNMNMPEEVNRVLTDRISNILFTPTNTASDNLKKEGYQNLDFSKVVFSGDIMYEGAKYYSKFARKPNYELPKSFILSTIHRAETTDNEDNLRSVISALNTISKTTQVVVPMHPRTKKIISDKNINIEFKVIEPVGYLEMIWLIKNCKGVITDSGGLQKEAFFFDKKCITMRTETEWVELIELGVNELVGYDIEKIISASNKLDNFPKLDVYPYGHGNTSEIVINTMLNFI